MNADRMNMVNKVNNNLKNRLILAKRQMLTGYQMLWCVLLLTIVSVNASANELISLSYESRSNGGEFSLDLIEPIEDPQIFSTAQPPRLIIELPDTYTELPASPIVLDNNDVRSYTTISDGSRTRVIVDLMNQRDYELSYSGNRVVVQLNPTDTTPVAAPVAIASVSDEVAARSAANEISDSVETTTITPRRGETAAQAPTPSAERSSAGSSQAQLLDIDFRRTATGGGRVILDLSNTDVSSAVNERGQELHIDLFNTAVPAELERVLDVVDFATPVMRITTNNSAKGASTLLRIAGEYTHEAFLDGDQFIVEIEPVVLSLEEEEDLTSNLFQNREYVGDRVTFNFQDIGVRSVLQLIADVSDLNIVVSDSAVGNVTLRLNNVPWDQALDLVLDTKNLDQRRNGNVIWVAPADEIAAREQQLLQALQDKIQLEPLNSVILSISYAEAQALADIIQATASGDTDNAAQGLLSPRGSVNVDQRTNTLLLTDTQDRIDDIRKLIERLDRPVRQVLIESRIVIANDDFSHELGVRFGVTSSGQDDNGSLFTTSGSLDATDQTNNIALRNRLALGGSGQNFPNFAANGGDGAGIIAPSLDNRLNVNLPAASPAGSLGFSILAADYLLDLELSALETEGRGEVVSTPRVVTANQAEAFIRQGVDTTSPRPSVSNADNSKSNR